MDNPQSNPVNPLIDPVSQSVIANQLLIPYTTTLPAWTAANGYRIVYNDGTNYWLYIYTNGGWQSVEMNSVASAIYGDGSDGAVTFDGSTTILGMVPSANVYTMTRDIMCTTIVVNGGVTVKTNGFRIFASTSINNQGTITAPGNAGSPGSSPGNGGAGATAAYTANSLPPTLSSGIGGNGRGNNTGNNAPGFPGVAGTAAVRSIGTSASGVSSGSGGTGVGGSQFGGTAGGANAAGGAITSVAYNFPHTPLAVYSLIDGGPSIVVMQGSASAAGGGGGGAGGEGAATAAGGTGGGGGGGGGGEVF